MPEVTPEGCSSGKLPAGKGKKRGKIVAISLEIGKMATTILKLEK
jgi:hypothetical protein